MRVLALPTPDHFADPDRQRPGRDEARRRRGRDPRLIKPEAAIPGNYGTKATLIGTPEGT